MGAETALAQLGSVAKQAENLPQRLIDIIDQIIQKINSLLQDVPPFLQEAAKTIAAGVQSAIEWLKKAVERIEKFFRDNILPFLASPSILYNTGNRWTTDVYSHANDAAGNILNSDDIQVYWTGSANTAYQKLVSTQGPAAQKIASLATVVTSTLQDMAWGVGLLYIAAVAILLAAVFDEIVSLVAMTTVIAIPPAIATAIMGLLGAIGGAAGIYGGFKVVGQAALNDFSKLLQADKDDSTFPQRQWPGKTGQLALDVGALNDPTSPFKRQ